MTNTSDDQGSAANILSAYRRRQKRAERTRLLYVAGLLLVIAAAAVFYRLTRSPNFLLAFLGTETPTPIHTATLTQPADPLHATVTQTAQPTNSPAPSRTPTPKVILYEIKEGDTLIGIAAHFGVDLPALYELNPRVTPEYLTPGTYLSIPDLGGSGTTLTPAPSQALTTIQYKVVAGDTLEVIDARYGTTVAAIVEENNLQSPDEIQEGNVLIIPVKAGITPTGLPGQSTATPIPRP